MDRITESLMKELLINLEIKSENESDDFEKFVVYSIVSNEYSKTFELESLIVGKGNDTGIDGIAIIVNGQLVETIEEINDLLENNNYLEVDYVFIQSKTSPNFEGAAIQTFLFGVHDFFQTDPKLKRNDEITKVAEISNYLYSLASNFRVNPKLKIYYVCTGRWLNDENLAGIVKAGIENLIATNLFDTIDFFPLGARELASAYRKTKESINTTITFNNRITLPKINGVTQAFIGLLPFFEFQKIVSSTDGNLLNVFEDNVRDFQGENNDVNGGIANTISSVDSEIFSVLNNGVTIVCSSISITRDQVTIYDYQIVNGCQTSNVLYNNRLGEHISKVHVPIKLIATNDDEIKTRITLATNNQTPILKEQLAALTAFQRSLELYYNSFTGDSRLYYERRAKQYNSDLSIMKTKIITIPLQIKSFASMFLDQPHNVTSFFGLIVRKLNEKSIQIFNNDHAHSPYYTSALAYYKLEQSFRKGAIDTKFKRVRYHILMLFRILNSKEQMPAFNQVKKMDAYCQNLCDILNDEKLLANAFFKCCIIISHAEFNMNDKQDLKLVSKTKNLQEYAVSLDGLKFLEIFD